MRTLIALVLAFASTAPAQSTEQLDVTLFVQTPQGPNANGGIHVIWIPEPLIPYCLGKTAEQCSTMDYCVRTTNKNVKMCQAIDLKRLPAYPPGMRPGRVLSVTFFKLAGDYFKLLQDFYAAAPKDSLTHISQGARIRARIRFTRTPQDDDMTVLEMLGPP